MSPADLRLRRDKVAQHSVVTPARQVDERFTPTRRLFDQNIGDRDPQRRGLH
jgi:hypothetical protein